MISCIKPVFRAKVVFVFFGLILNLFTYATTQAQPQLSSDASHLMDVVPGRWNIKFDIRYATRNNVFGEQLYQRARPMLISPALIALDSAAAMLQKKGFGLIVYDAYRPWSVTEKMWQLTDSSKRAFVSNPSKGSRHNRGCAVDVSLYHLASGLPAEMPSDYDDFSEKASASYEGCSPAAAHHRAVLREAMERAGFKGIRGEWWHFDLVGWERWPLLNAPIE